MATCEKCWNDANGRAAEYARLLELRKDNPCTPEEQAGEGAKFCTECGGATMHIYAKVCMACGHSARGVD
jgi:hypothetical protein